MRVELVPNSMFSATPVYAVDGEVVFGLMVKPIVADASDRVFEVPLAGANRLDLISDAFYQTPELWWVIGVVNNILDPLVGVTPGTKLRIPTQARLAKEGVLN